MAGLVIKLQKLTSEVLTKRVETLRDINKEIGDTEKHLRDLQLQVALAEQEMQQIAEQSSSRYESVMRKIVTELGLTWPCRVKIGFKDNEPSHIEKLPIEPTSAVDSEPIADTVKLSENPEE